VPPPGVNYINILHADLTRADPKSTKKTDNLTVFFTHFGSERVKAARGMLMKLVYKEFNLVVVSFS